MVTYAIKVEGKAKAQKKTKGEILFKDIISCKAVSPAKLPKRGKTEEGAEVDNTFVLVTVTRTWYFSAESEIVRDLWVAAFQAIVQE